MLGLVTPVYGQRVNQDTVISTNICFYVSTTDIVKNDPGYDKYLNEMLPFMYDNINNLDSVVIRGAASPDGTDKFNSYLSEKRAEKIAKDLHFSKYMSDVIYAGEDYSRLFELITDDSILTKQVEEILQTDDPKRNIRKLPKYRYLMDVIYPQLRSAQVTMYFSEKDPCFTDTVYISQLLTDTVYDYRLDTVWMEKPLRKIPIVSVKTNLLADAVLAPNIQAEVYTHVWGLSIGFDYTFPWYHDDSKFLYYRLLRGSPVIRKYFNNEYDKHYIGLYGDSYEYDFCINKNDGWQGEGIGLGLEYGYAFRNDKHPRLKWELFARVGWLNTKYDTYHAGEPFEGKYYYDWYLKASDFVPRRFVLNYFGPTAIGINISYDIICLRRY